MADILRIFDRQPLTLRGAGDAEVTKVARARPEKETHLTKRPDRVGPYLVYKMKEFAFDEFSRDYLKKGGFADELSGVPIPLRDEDLEAFKNPEGLKGNIIAENMARVLGIDPRFKYRDAYASYIDRFFGKKAVDNMTRKAKDHADRQDYDEACVYFRAGLALKFDDMPAMYGYARVLRTLYENSGKEDYIGNLKAESLDYFEMTTELYPRFDMAWYYLGYMYLNLGLYMKAKLAWGEYLKNGRIMKDRREIKKRLEQ
ncbi:MAG: hypothetical protein LBS91_10015, partial [Clostridiales Family XIII bacterium]|nr:hypothetical protein [Clostridiales Family XIII bacterium]